MKSLIINVWNPLQISNSIDRDQGKFLELNMFILREKWKKDLRIWLAESGVEELKIGRALGQFSLENIKINEVTHRPNLWTALHKNLIGVRGIRVWIKYIDPTW